MIELRFKDFEGIYVDDGYQLYVMKNGLDDVLYVGISRVDIWSRWFGFSGHMIWDGKFVIGNSTIGQKIADHYPDSENWIIQLWLLEDCAKFCNNIVSSEKRHTIQMLEPYMIQKLSPALNVHYNLKPGKDTTPRSQKEIAREKELDDAYRQVFENKK